MSTESSNELSGEEYDDKAAETESGSEGHDPAGIVEDPRLERAEKETHLHFDKGSEKATVETNVGTHMRRLVAHPHAETGNPSGETSGVTAKIPIGCILIKVSPRASAGHCHVIPATVLTSDNP